MTIEQYAVLCMKWMGLQHEANYCVTTPEDAKRLQQEIVDVETLIRSAPWKVVKGEIVAA